MYHAPMARDLSKFLEEVAFDVEDDAQGLRLDHFLVDRIFWRSRTDLQARVKRGAVLLNDGPTKVSVKLKAGDRIRPLATETDL